MAIVVSGTAAAQAITMAFAPIITRLYGPEAFGLLGVFLALAAILTPVAALTYPIAIVLPKGDGDAAMLAKLSFFIALGVASFTTVVLLTGGNELLKLLDSEAIAPYVMLIPLSMLFAACVQIAQQWLIRKKQFSITARVAVIQAMFVNSAKAGIGWFHPVAAVLLVLATVGAAFHAMLLWVGICKSKTLPDRDNQEHTSLKALAKEHRDFPLFRTPQVAINALSQSLPALMLASFFGPASAGFYTIGKMVLGVPSTLIGKSVGDVFYPRITEAAHKGENLTRLIIKATGAVAAVGFTPFVIIIAFGPWLFHFVFGSEWSTAGEYSRWLALYLFFGLLTVPVINVIPIIKRQGEYLIIENIGLVIRFLSIFLSFQIFNDPLITVAFYSVFASFEKLFIYFYFLLKLKDF